MVKKDVEMRRAKKMVTATNPKITEVSEGRPEIKGVKVGRVIGQGRHFGCMHMHALAK